MSENKGKSRATPGDNESSLKDGEASIASQLPQTPSLLSRVAASAEGLTRSVFAPPNNAEVSESMASALSSSGKTQSSGSTSSSAILAESSTSSLTSSNQQQSAGGSNGFRAGHHVEHIQQSETEFSDFLDGIDSFKPSDVSGKDGATENFEVAWSKSQNLQSRGTPNRTVAEQESRDGEDVLELLSTPTAFDDEQFRAPLDEDVKDWGLSSEQLTQLRAMTKELFPQSTPHGNISSDNPLNLIPSSDVTIGSQLMGHSDIDAMGEWRDQWEGVLTRYTDEVWGGLLPLVKAARQEVEELKERGQEHTQPKALRRLGAILGHLQRR